jgi:hypothetical protein
MEFQLQPLKVIPHPKEISRNSEEIPLLFRWGIYVFFLGIRAHGRNLLGEVAGLTAGHLPSSPIFG